MSEEKPDSAGRTVLSFAADALIAGGTAGLGAAVAWLSFLGVMGLVEHRWPRSGDIRALPWIVILGLIAGLVGGIGLRSFVGRIRSPKLWAIGFFFIGGVAGPLALIALVGWAISKTGGW